MTVYGWPLESHPTQGRPFWSRVLSVRFNSLQFEKRQLPGFRVMLRFWGMSDSMIRAVILMAFAFN